MKQNTFVVHESCSTTFRTRLKRLIFQGKKLSPLNFANDEDHEIENNQDMGEKRKSRRSLDDSIERVCFVCDKASGVSLPYNGVGRCSESSAEINMKHAKDMWLIEPNGECFDAAERLNTRLIGCDGDTIRCVTTNL